MRWLFYSFILVVGFSAGWLFGPLKVERTAGAGMRPEVSVQGEAELATLSSPTGSSHSPARSGSAMFDWRQVESPDYREYVANLRAIGCPEETVQDIVSADVTKLYDERIREARQRFGAFQYWRTDAATNWTGEVRSAITRLRHEQKQVLAELLGVNNPVIREGGDSTDVPFDPRLDFLSPQIQRRIVEIQHRHDERVAELLAGGDAALSRESDDPIGELRAEREAALGEVLSAEEREEYELRASPVAEKLRASLAGVEVSEAEFRELFRARREFQKDYPEDPFDFLNSEKLGRKSVAEVALKSEFSRILGEHRFSLSALAE